MAQFSQTGWRLSGVGVLAALVLLALPLPAHAQASTSGVPCPLTAGELSSIVGRQVERVNLGEPSGDPTSQCSFSAAGRSSTRPFVSPQVFLTVDPGGVGDLRDLYAYYQKARAKLATRPQIDARPDLGPGAFTLTASTMPVTTAFFLIGKGSGVGTLVVDLTDAAATKRAPATANKVFALVRGRLR